MKVAFQRTGSPVRLSDDDFYLTVIAVLAVLAWGVVTLMALLLHRNFLTIACDTTVLQNAIINTIHGHWFANNGAGGPNVLGSHTTFLLLLVIPFYIIAPYPETLFALQTAGVFSTIFPLFLLGRDFGLKPLLAFCIAATGLLSGFLIHMAMAPFHLETWIAAAALWSYHFYLRGNLTGFLISLLVAVCCGEQAALIFIALGLGLLLVRDDLAWRRRFGWISLGAGVAWIILDVGIVTPSAAGSSPFNIFAYNYADWGVKSASGLPGAMARHPQNVIAHLINPYRWGHVVSVIGLLLVAAFFSWRSLLLLLPMPAYLLMSQQEFFLYFHAYYYSFAFFAGYIGLLSVLGRVDPAGRLTVIGLSLFWLVAVMTLCDAMGYYYQLAGGVDEPFSTTIRAVFARIPSTATVYGPHRFSVYLSNRENFVMGDLPLKGEDFKAMVDAEFNKTNVHASQIDFIVSDFWTDQCGWRRGFLNSEKTQARSDAITRLVATGKWQVFWQDHDVAVLQRAK
jgi:uncharacterized membrane protein